jgi:hypothetical protein
MPEETIDTVYLIGTGAEIGSWEPVLEAIQALEVEGIGDPRQVAHPESAVSYFGTLIHLRREMLRIAALPGLETDEASSFRKKAEDLGTAHAELKEGIAAKLVATTALGTLRLRDGFVSFVNAHRGTRAFLTTNWDLLLEDALTLSGKDPKKVVHLHGDVNDSRTMLLPGEIMGEPYRNDAEAEAMQQKLETKWGVLEAAKCFVIYGHSLSGIEAELRLLLQLGFSGQAKRPGIKIVSASSQDSNLIALRLRPLLPPGEPWSIEPLVGEP